MPSLWHTLLITPTSLPRTPSSLTPSRPPSPAPSPSPAVAPLPARTHSYPPPSTTSLPPTTPATAAAMMDSDIDPSYSRWRYATSDARSEPIPPPRPAPQIVPQSRQTPSPPPIPSPPLPVEISTGVWLDDDGIVYSEAWPPVQEYLLEVREARTMVPAPSDLVFTLAALSVLQHTKDIAHWIFWNQGTYWTIGERVDSIALQKTKLIKSPIPWNGHKEYKAIVNARQEKFACVVVQRKWYPTDGNGADAHKRTLRSTTGLTEPTVNDFFGIIENEGPSRRRGAKTVAKRHVLPSPNKRTRRPVPQADEPTAHRSSSPEPVVPADDEDVAISIHSDAATRATSPPVNRTSTRVRRKVTPSARSPRIISAVVPRSPSDEAISPVQTLPLPTTPSSATHSRNRSSSAQSSASVETIVVAERSPSVTSVETAVAPSSPKKRKMTDVELEDDDNDVVGKGLEAIAVEGRVTRNRASRARSGDSDKSRTSSRMSTPAATEPPAKLTRPRVRAKRARV